MPRYRVVLLAEARDELRQIALIHKVKVGSKSAKRITDRILEALRKLEDFPTMGTLPPYERIVRAGYRMLIIDDYLCFYAIRGAEVHVVPFPVSWTVKMKKKQKETQDILSYHTQAAGCSDKARAKESGGRQPIEECGRTGL